MILKRNARIQIGALTVTRAPAQRDLFTRRWRKPPSMSPAEYKIQIAVMQHYRLRRCPGVVGWHTPNGELRDKRHAAKLKAMGVLPGVADLQFTFPTIDNAIAPTLFLELKSRGQKLTDDQKVFRDLMRAAGHIYEWADSIDEALRILLQRGAIK